MYAGYKSCGLVARFSVALFSRLSKSKNPIQRGLQGAHSGPPRYLHTGQQGYRRGPPQPPGVTLRWGIQTPTSSSWYILHKVKY